LPDGLRDRQASHLLLEFKYTQSLTGKAARLALADDHFYKEVQELTDSDVQTVLLCAKPPQADHLTQYGYLKTSLPGVYQSQWHSWLPPVMLLSLNELSDAPHNACVKGFASRLTEKRKAFKVLPQFFTTDNFPDSLKVALLNLQGLVKLARKFCRSVVLNHLMETLVSASALRKYERKHVAP
jgi:hypothetical protein